MEWLLPVVDRLLRRLVLVIVRLCVRFKVLIEPTLAAVCGASQHLAEPGKEENYNNLFLFLIKLGCGAGCVNAGPEHEPLRISQLRIYSDTMLNGCLNMVSRVRKITYE